MLPHDHGRDRGVANRGAEVVVAGTGDYTAEAIVVLSARAGVRRRPGMYIGSVASSAGLHILLWEVVGNALDEYVAGHATTITIQIDGAHVTVQDDGRGIPGDAIERIFTLLHAGTAGKRPHRHLALDLHATGVSVTNFLSETFEVTSWREGRAHRQCFVKGEPRALERLGPAAGSGTRVTFAPDFSILTPQPWDVAMIRERCRELAGIEPGLRIALGGEAWCYGSLGDYLREGRDLVEPLDVGVVEREIGVRVALGWHAGPASIRTLVNGSPSGGVHEVALRDAVARVFARRLGRRVARASLERGMLAALHITLDAPQWNNPTRAWLTNPDVAAVVGSVVERELDRHFDEAPAVLDALLLRYEASATRGRARRSTARPRTRPRTPAARGTRSS